MTASNGIRTEHKIKRLAAAVALAIAAMLAAASLSPARADAAGTSDGNIVIDVPTTVPCALMADGTVVSPSEWKITTSGDAYIASASASGFPANVEWSARTTDLAAGQAGSVQVSATGNAVSVAGPSDPADAALAGTARFEWSFSKLDAGKNADVVGKAAGGTAVLGSVTFTFAKTEPDSFAVYSADDNSLMFYKRAGVPVAGQTFEGKTATEVYTGIETMTSIPGWTQNHFNDIKTVTVHDTGIAPTGTAFWFAGVRNLKTADVSKLDMSRCKTIECMFTDCISLQTLDLSGWDTSSLTNMSQAFQHCASLTKLNVSGWDVSKVTNMQLVFAEDKALGSLDLSTWDNSAATSMKDAFLQMDSLNEISLGSKFKFVGTNGYLPTPSSAYIAGADGRWYDTDGNGYAPADIPSNKAMTYTAVAPKKAFAVYSADDNSLSFYKRSSVPAPGDAFEGKTATGVYTGFETQQFDGYLSNVPWLSYQSNVKTVTVADEGIAPVSTANWFYSFTNVESINLSKLDTRNVTSMYCMFRGCKTLTTLDVSSFSTANVTNMGSMFDGCSALTSLDLTSFDTGNVWKTASMFYNCKALTTLDVSSFDTANVKYMGCMFCNCKALTSLDLSSFDTGSVTDMDSMFDGCSALTSLDLSSFDTTNVTNMRSMFFDCKALTALGVSSFATEKVTNMYGMFYNGGSLTSLDVSSFDTGKVTDMGSMFYGCKTLTTLDVSSFSTANVTNMGSMFDGCSALTSLDLSSFDTSNVTNMYGMFYNCGSLTSLDVSHFDTSNATNMSNMFYGCAALPALDVLSFDTDKVTDMGSMFYGCKTLTTLDVSSFSTANVTNMSWMFNECKALTALDLSSFSTENVTNMGYMFRLCPKLQKVTFGADWKWVGTSGYLPTPSSTYIAGAAGKWYDTEGNGYAPKDIPSSKAMTYTAIAPEKAFAVYSADDQSLTFYKRVNVPSAGEQFEGKTATAVFTGIETNEYYDDNPWCNYTDEIKTASVVDEGIAPVSTAYWFTSCKNLTTADLTKLDTSNVTRMTEMFHFCSSLAKLEGISSWNTSKVVSMSSMFDLCPLTSLDLSNWDTSNVEYMQSMFSSCSSLTSVGDISSWDTSKVTSISDMFTGCSSLKTLNLSNWDMSNVTKIDGIFFKCSSLTSIGDISGWNTSKVTLMQNMFNGCSKLSASCLNWDVSKVTNHRDFNKNATGVTVPLAWQASSDEGGEDPAIALLCEEQGNGNALSVPSGTTKAEAASKTEGKPLADNETEGGNTASADVEGATQKDAMGKQQLGETALKESDASSELDGVEKNAEAKPAVEDEATKEDVSATEPEGIEKAVVKKSGE